MRKLIWLVTIIGSGCATTNFWHSPKFNGRVVNQSGAVVVDVRVFDVNPNRKTSKLMTKTDDKGQFEILPEVEQVRVFMPGDLGTNGYYLFEKEGYQSAAVSYRALSGGPTPPQMPQDIIVLVPTKRSE